MSAIVVNLKDVGLRTPEQLVRIFYTLYNASEVREELFQLFALLSVTERNGSPALEGREESVIQLFDQLVFLADAIEKLQQGMSEANHCAICGAEKTGPVEDND